VKNWKVLTKKIKLLKILEKFWIPQMKKFKNLIINDLIEKNNEKINHFNFEII
jgi:hypothetical protein